MATSTIRDVELVSAGTWNASQGDGNITAEDIASMAAAYNDPMRDRIPIKIGHTDSRFQDKNGNPPAGQDGHPAYGWVENVRMSKDGRKLLGDLVGVPTKLAEAMPSAFRNRSVEFVPGKRLGGKVYRAVLTAVAVLGQSAPAVKGLSDVLALYSQRHPVMLSQATVETSEDAAHLRALRSFVPHLFVPEGPRADVAVVEFRDDAAGDFHRRAMATFCPRPI